jgi:hypothetical protein
VDAIHEIQFTGHLTPGGTFRLTYVDEAAGIIRTTEPIRIESTLQATAQNIKAALTAQHVDLDVEVGATSHSVLIQFVGRYGAKAVAPLIVQNVNLQNPKAGQSIVAVVQTTGESSETRANDTTAGDKRYPALAIATSGEVIITWTSWGQGADSPYETNVYAKNFPSNAVIASMNRNVSLSQRIETVNNLDRNMLKITTTEAPNNHLTTSSEYTGVVWVTVENAGVILWSGSGSLLSSGMHILTAAHVTADGLGNALPAGNIFVTFNLPSGTVKRSVSQNYLHWSITGNYFQETDLAILTLSEIAPAEATRYDIYRDSDEIGKVQTTVGYGATGTGATGEALPGGQKRWGMNTYEATADIFERYGIAFHPDILVYDFDSGLPRNDAFGHYFGIYNTGLGYLESSSARGDSGGPAFIDGKIAGVVSGGGPIFPLSATDVSPAPSSFGEFSLDVRVSSYADWIDSIVSTGTTEYLVNQTEAGNQMWPDVAISMSGEVIFTWTGFNQEGGIGTGPGGSANDTSSVYARRFHLDGTPVSDTMGGTDIVDPDTGAVIGSTGGIALGDEFRVNDYLVGNQWYSSVSVANNGDFMIVWESYQDKSTVTTTLPDTGHGVGGTATETVTDYGVYAKRFTNLETLLRSQDNPGGAQYGLPDNTRFVPGYGYVGIHGEIGAEFRVNRTQLTGDQTGATVALNANGDAIVVFQSQVNSVSNIYYRAITLSEDRSAPVVTETVLVVDQALSYDASGNPVTHDDVLMPVRDGSVIYGSPTHMVVTFSEEMFHALLYDPSSILNLSNWQLFRNGTAVFGAIENVEFGRNLAFDLKITPNTRSGKWEAVITFSRPLASGEYLLVLRDSVTDLAGNRLDGDYNGTAGGTFNRSFLVISPITSEEDPGNPGDPGSPVEDKSVIVNTEFGNDKPAIASADNGAYVVVAVHYGSPGSPTEPGLIFDPADWDWALGLPRLGNIVMQRYDRNGDKIGAELVVNTYMTGTQTDPDVAMDGTGNIAVVWSGVGATSNTGIYLRLYDAFGRPVGDQIWVNEVSSAVCSTPKVAYDNNGNIVVTWMEYNSTTRSQVVMARVYDSNGVQQSVALNGASSSRSSMALVAENTRDVRAYDIAFAPNGELIITWQMSNNVPGNNSQDIFAKVLKYTAGSFVTTVNTFVVNTHTNQQQMRPSVAASQSGFVITWASYGQAALADRPDLRSDSYDIFARRFNWNGVAQPTLGTTGDCLISSQKVTSERTNNRDYPEVSMAPNGNFVITWSSYDQEPNNFNGGTRRDYGAFARAFSGNGNALNTDYAPQGEFRLNTTILGNQMYSVTAMSNHGISFAWVGPTESYWIVEYDETGVPVGWIPFETVDVFSRIYTVRTNVTIPGQGQPGGVFNSLLRSAYSPAQWVGGGGYIGQGTNTYKYDNQEVLFLDGTDGDDVFEILVTASGTFAIKVNGKSVTAGSQVREIHIDGLGGNDRLMITNTAGDNTAKLNAVDQLVSFATQNGALTLSALRTENVELNVGGTNNSLQVVAGANDVLTAKVNEALLAGEGHSFLAKGFGILSALATNSSAAAFLFDSAGDDTLTMSPGKAVMKGQEFEHSISGFGNITAYSTRGNDTAILNGSTGDDAVFASGGTVAMAGSTYRNTVFGFDKTFVVGNGGNDSATLVGSYAADRFIGSDSLMEAVFGRSGSVNFYDFRNFTIHGNGGNDVVALSNITQGTGLNANNTSATKTYLNSTAAVTYTVTGINDVRGIPQQAQAAAQAASAALSETMDDIYQLLALEHEQNTKKTAEDQGDELDIDYLLKTGAL